MLRGKNIFTRLIFHPKIIFILGLTILILITLPLARVVSHRYEINKEIRELEDEIENIENKNANITKVIEFLKSNQFVEKEARLKLGLKKEGEEVAIIKNTDEAQEMGANLDNDSDPSSSAEAANKESIIFNIPGLEKDIPVKKINNPRRWWNYFLNGESVD